MTLTLLISYNPLYKILVSIIILVITIRIQIRLKPYKNEKNNDIELLGIYAGAFTLFTGIIFTDSNGDAAWMNLFLFIWIVIVNVYFIMRWFYLWVESMSERYKIFQKILRGLDVIMWHKGKKKNAKILLKPTYKPKNTFEKAVNKIHRVKNKNRKNKVKKSSKHVPDPTEFFKHPNDRTRDSKENKLKHEHKESKLNNDIAKEVILEEMSDSLVDYARKMKALENSDNELELAVFKLADHNSKQTLQDELDFPTMNITKQIIKNEKRKYKHNLTKKESKNSQMENLMYFGDDSSA